MNKNELRHLLVRGFGISGLITGAYLVLPWITNNNALNSLFGWVLGIISGLIILVDGFSGGFKDKVILAGAITGVLTAFYLVSSWVPNNNVANMGFGVLLIITALFSFGGK